MAARYQRQVGPARGLPSAGGVDFAGALDGVRQGLQQRASRNRMADVEQQGQREGLAGTAQQTAGFTDAQRVYNAAALKGFEVRLSTQARSKVATIMAEIDPRNPDSVKVAESRIGGAFDGIMAEAPAEVRESLAVELDLRRQSAIAQVTEAANRFELQRNVATIDEGIKADQEDYFAAMQDGRDDVAVALRERIQSRLGDLVGMGILTEEQATLRVSEADEAASAEALIGGFKRSVRSSAGALAAIQDFNNNPPADLSLAARTRVIAGMSQHATILARGERQARAGAKDQQRAIKARAREITAKLEAGVELAPEDHAVLGKITDGSFQLDGADFEKLQGAADAYLVSEEILGMSPAAAQTYATFEGKPKTMREWAWRKAVTTKANEHAAAFEKDPLGYGAKVLGTPIAPFDVTQPAGDQLELRAQIAAKVSDEYGVEAPLLSETDVRVLKQSVESMNEDQAVGLLGSLVAVAGDGDQLNTTIEDLVGRGAEDLAGAASLVAAGRPDDARSVLVGAKSRDLLPTDDKAVNPRKVIGEAVGTLGTTIPMDTPEFRMAANVATNLVRGRAVRSGDLDVVKDDDAIRAAVADVFGVPGRVQGRDIALPKGLSPVRLQDALERLTPESVEVFGPMLMEPEALIDAFEDGSAGLESITPGHYRLMLGATAVKRPDGNPVVVTGDELKGLAEMFPPLGKPGLAGAVQRAAGRAAGRLGEIPGRIGETLSDSRIARDLRDLGLVE